MPDWAAEIEAAKEIGVSWPEIQNLPKEYTEHALAKLSAEAYAEKIDFERRQKEIYNGKSKWR